MSLRRAALLAAAIVGAGLTLDAYLILDDFNLHAGTDLQAYLGAGRALRDGLPVYTNGLAAAHAFLYSPVWAVMFIPISLFPGWLVQGAVLVLDVVALRYVTGSWLAVGLVGLFPVTWFELSAGNIEFLIAASIVLAWRKTSAPLVVMAFAKLSPALALPRTRWKESLVVAAVLFTATLPWAHLWVDYARFLLEQPASAGTVIAIPWYVRLPFGLALLAVRRPWAQALAAVVAIPAWFLYTSLILLAPLRLWLDERSVTVVGTTSSHRRASLPSTTDPR